MIKVSAFSNWRIFKKFHPISISNKVHFTLYVIGIRTQKLFSVIIQVSFYNCFFLFSPVSQIRSYIIQNWSNKLLFCTIHVPIFYMKILYQRNWRPPSVSEFTPYQISLGLTHFGSEASISLWPKLLEIDQVFFFQSILLHISRNFLKFYQIFKVFFTIFTF